VLLFHIKHGYEYMSCKVEGCQKDTDRKGFCSLHYMRQWRNGTTDKIQKRKEKLIHSHGYIIIYDKGHKLADKNGCVYQHRHGYYQAYGEGPFDCYWCGKIVCWDNLHIDHLDDDKTNNDIDNLKATCPRCNQKRGAEKVIATWRSKTGIEYKSKVYSVQELSDMRGISRQSMIARLKKMDIYEAMEKPKGKTGPKTVI